MASKGKLYTSYFSSKKSQGIKIAVVRFKPDWLDFNCLGKNTPTSLGGEMNCILL